jgi:hypothetical protein
MKVKISPGLRRAYADKILDLTNIGAGATLFGQFFSERGFSVPVALSGLAILVLGYTVAYFLYERGVDTWENR